MTLAKAGQKANLPDQSVGSPKVAMNATPKTASTASTSDYVPQAGDEVSFEVSSDVKVGLIYFEGCFNELKIVADFGNSGSYSHMGLDWVDAGSIKKIGYTSTVPDVCEIVDAMRIAKAYFAKAKAFTPDPGKSYAENQKEWVEFHGLKQGSKVKVVRKETDSVPWNINGRMDATIGMTGSMFEAGIYSLRVTFSDDSVWAYQYECLEPVK